MVGGAEISIVCVRDIDAASVPRTETASAEGVRTFGVWSLVPCMEDVSGSSEEVPAQPASRTQSSRPERKALENNRNEFVGNGDICSSSAAYFSTF